MKSSRVRWATPADNDALISLVRDCPNQGEVELYFDRSPDFFALSRIQGEGAQVCVAEDAGGRIVASAAVARFPAMYVDGVAREVTYACDLRIHPDHRRGFIAKRIHDFLEAWAHEQAIEVMFTAVMGGNAAMAPVLSGKAALVPYLPLATVRNFTVQFMLKRRAPRGIQVRPATAADLPAMGALWNRLMADKQFAPAHDDALFTGARAEVPGWALENHLLAFRDGRLVGSILCWDQSAFKRMRVLAYAGSMLRMRRWYNPLARVLGRCPLPDPGSFMPYFYAVRPCAETVEDLRALYVAIHNAHLGRGHLFFSAMHDVRDPMAAALDGFTSQQVEIGLYLIDPARKWHDHKLGDRLCYFDPSLV